MKDELWGQITEEFAGLIAKTCSYLKENNAEDEKAKSTKENLNLKIMKSV